MIPWVTAGEPFPPVESALSEPNGLLAASIELEPGQLLAAYRQGIFPWYAGDQPVLWWSPDPRMVLLVAQFRVSRSLRRRLRAVAADPALALTVDTDFDAVMAACAVPRPGQDGTWIGAAVRSAYGALARAGHAHSVELRRGDELLGGLYGVALGRMFFGESMFARETDASKVALAALVALMRCEGVPMIDCQQKTAHLASLGGHEIRRRDFCAHLARAAARPAIDWTAYRGRRLNAVLEVC